MENKTTHINGDAGYYLGTSEVIHGGTFYHVMMTEGRFAGTVKVTSRPAAGESPFTTQARANWQEMQAGFSRLNRA